MNDSAEVFVHPGSSTRTVSFSFSDRTLAIMQEKIFEHVIENVASALAEQFITEHGQEVLAAMDPQKVLALVQGRIGAKTLATFEDDPKPYGHSIRRLR